MISYDILFAGFFFTRCIFRCGGFDVNFMDDVGQTILNWASAFGTNEMVRKA